MITFLVYFCKNSTGFVLGFEWVLVEMERS